MHSWLALLPGISFANSLFFSRPSSPKVIGSRYQLISRVAGLVGLFLAVPNIFCVWCAGWILEQPDTTPFQGPILSFAVAWFLIIWTIVISVVGCYTHRLDSHYGIVLTICILSLPIMLAVLLASTYRLETVIDYCSPLTESQCHADAFCSFRDSGCYVQGPANALLGGSCIAVVIAIIAIWVVVATVLRREKLASIGAACLDLLLHSGWAILLGFIVTEKLPPPVNGQIVPAAVSVPALVFSCSAVLHSVAACCCMNHPCRRLAVIV